jgi:hypothetical protein
MAAIACNFRDVLVGRVAAMVTAVFVIAARCTAAAVMGALSVVSHNYLHSKAK